MTPKPKTKSQGAISIHPVDLEDTTGAVTCEVVGCHRMALQKVTMAGYPAGFLCMAHGHKALRLWAELTAEDHVPMGLAA